MGWVTINGAHIEIGEDGLPKSETGKQILKERTGSDPKMMMAKRGSENAHAASEKALKSGESKDNEDARKSHFASMETHMRMADKADKKDPMRAAHEKLTDAHHAMAQLHKGISEGYRNYGELKAGATTHMKAIKEHLEYM